jgi:hypothetical protein
MEAPPSIENKAFGTKLARVKQVKIGGQASYHWQYAPRAMEAKSMHRDLSVFQKY